jgi:hypothetical protein
VLGTLTSLKGISNLPMIELDIQTIDRLLNGMLWTIGPYLDEKGAILERPWLFELTESYNEIVSMLPAQWKLEHHQFLHYD